MRIVRGLLFATSSALCALSFGCGSNEAPTIDPIPDKVAYANSTLELTITGRDPDGDTLKFAYSSDIPDFMSRDGVQFFQDGRSALFRWTPRPIDIGVHSFDFTATDGKETAKAQVYIDVRYQPSANAPVFREPLGTGTIVDLGKTPEIRIRVVAEDPDTSEITIDHEDPVIDGARVEQDGPQTATWVWEPTPAQIAADDRYRLTLSADDHSNPKVLKNYLIVLKKTVKQDCPGAPPVIAHTPSNETTIVGLTIEAQVSDDKGIAHEPLLYYAFQDPGSVPDLTKMAQVTMLQFGGDAKNGTWAADVPNPVANEPAGTSRDVYYVMVAQDNDDEVGDCDHVTQHPPSASFKMTVTNPGGQGGLGLCKPCTHDTQCGGGGDNCLPLGSSGEGYCGKACSDDVDCPPTQYYCSLTKWPSTDGVEARQCIPSTYECTGTTEKCDDDTFEPNDTREQVLSADGLLPGSYNLVSCPGATIGANEDWFVFDMAGDAQVKLTLQGGSASDLDLQLVDKDGKVVATSGKLGSSESIAQCLSMAASGYYFIRVYSSSGNAKNTYKLTYESTGASCSSTCADDSHEPDDTRAQARNVPVDYGSTYKVQNNQICSGNDDWYKLSLFKDEYVFARVAFTQTDPKHDLDVRFYDGTTSLTKCTETDTSGCDSSNGQSSTPNENFKWKVSATGTYYVVVHGWQGAQNKYDICIHVNNTTTTLCPALP